jgi:hypothetical protein
MSELYQMTNQRRIAIVIGSLIFSGAQFVAFSYVLRLEFSMRRSILVAISLLGFVLGWSGVAFWILAPVSKKRRWRGIMTAMTAIFGGAAMLCAEAESGTWMWVSISGALLAAFLSFFPITSNRAATYPNNSTS